jgi:HEAT repeat protein
MRKIVIFLTLLAYVGAGCASTAELKRKINRWEKERNTEKLIEALENDNWFVRTSAAKALGRIADPQAIKALVGMLGDKNRYMRREVINILAKVGQPATEHLIVVLKEFESGVAHKSAVEALVRIGQPATLFSALRNEDSDIRRAAARTLNKIDWQPKNEKEKAFLLAVGKTRWSGNRGAYCHS